MNLRYGGNSTASVTHGYVYWCEQSRSSEHCYQFDDDKGCRQHYFKSKFEEQKEDMKTYTAEQIKIHGALIQKHLNDPSLEIQAKNGTGLTSNIWINLGSGDIAFHAEHEYRVKPEPLFVNDIGERFYEKDVCFFYAMHNNKMYKKSVNPLDEL